MRRKVNRCRGKFTNEEVTEQREWTRRISEGSGAARQRVQVTVPVYVVVTFNCSKTDC